MIAFTVLLIDPVYVVAIVKACHRLVELLSTTDKLGLHDGRLPKEAYGFESIMEVCSADTASCIGSHHSHTFPPFLLQGVYRAWFAVR